MAEFEVKEIIDGDTFVVSKGWTWDGKTGDRVRPAGYDTPEKGEPGYEAAKSKLAQLILGKTGELGKVHVIDRGRIVCEVVFKGKNLADYFPEYKK